MKKLISLVAAGMLVAAFVPGTAVAGKKKGVRQDVTGTIAMQAPPADATDNPNGCYSGIHRRLNVVTQMQANGIVGFHFEIDPATWGKKFRLTNETAGADLDITFYTEFGTLEQAAETSYAPQTFAHEERNEEGEFGKVPADMTLAIVCMKVGQNATFTYSAGAGVK
ncbi:MAG TPA: hypothetical protein VJ927_09275 [Actinomycetota bacterium]|nr:hypothetical protein [Actinomycetota bacterium]